jgi:hypothetical protein
VAFEVVDGDERLVEAEGESLRVGDANEECSGESRAGGDGYGVEVGEGDWIARRGAGAGHGLADHGDNVAEVLTGGKFRDNATVVGVKRHLGGYDVRESFAACANDGGCGLVAGAFDAQDESCAEAGSVAGRFATLRAFGHLSIIGEA